MSYEIFELEAGGPSSGLLVPGRVLRALAVGADVAAEDVGTIEPLKRGSVAVEIARHRALTLATPRLVPSLEGGQAAVFVLRRADDEASIDEARELLVSWDDGPAPAPGEVAVALAEALDGFAEELGFGLAGATFLRVQVPLAWVLRGIPTNLQVGPRALRLELAEKKKPVAPSERLAARANALRDELERGILDAARAAARLAAYGRKLLVVFPSDASLIDTFVRLRSRGFVPPPRADLPLGETARVLGRWSAEDRAERARDLVNLPDPKAAPELAWATLELLLRVPGEEERALELIARMHKANLDASRLALAEFRRGSGDWGQRLATLRTTKGALPEGLRRAASSVLRSANVPWLVPFADDTAIANVALAVRRRPALAREHERIFDWLDQAKPAPFVAEAEAADQAGDTERGTTLLIAALDAHGWPGDREAVLAARRALLLDEVPRPWRFPLPAPTPPAPPHGGWAKQLRGEPEPALLEHLGDRKRAAEAYLSAGRVADALRFRDVLDDARLVAALGKGIPDDERTIAANPQPALSIYALLAPGPERDMLALRLAAAGQALGPVMAPIEAAASEDPHHPENRLAAASDLLAAGRVDPAGNILAALVRKADEGAPPRLWTVAAQALEAEEPSPDLVHAATRALHALVPALRDNPSAAFTLHEPLLQHAQDPSRGDAERLAALEAWLNIWRATETPPDPASLESLRHSEPELLAVAAARLAEAPSPSATMATFLAAHPTFETTPDAFSEGLLALSLGR